MIFLANPLITPNVGTIFWTLLIFILLLIMLRKFAWGPILSGLKVREQSIQDALDEAKRARADMERLNAQNEQLLQEARLERDKILREARETKDRIVAEARAQAQEEAKRVMQQSQEALRTERQQAFKQLKEEVVTLAMNAAERILQRELDDQKAQEKLIEQYLHNVDDKVQVS